MNGITRAGVMIVAMLLIVSGSLFAQMGPMGPPEELKKCEILLGEWEVDMTFYMDTVEMKSKGTAEYTKTLGGAAIKMDYHSTMMNMPFEGLMLMTYDRETEQWQSVWIDNMAARISFYTGTVDEDKSVMEGEDRYDGKVMLARITTFNHTPDSFDWKYESSADSGETWFTSGIATYTKKK